MDKRELTCIICPRGCQLSAEASGEEITVSGNLCPRGKTYAINECTNPVRTVTTTARTSDGGVVAVKTASPIPKDKMAECMAIINSCVVKLPVRVGDVILRDVFGAEIVATQNKG
ncbi:MAG: DUF1667 domain-containing protein [Eubacteriales bacterium]